MTDVLARSYDVVVVGAGSAGAALAARLTEDEGRTVLLLEHGPDYRSADAPEEVRSQEPAKVQPTEVLARLMHADLLARRTPAQEPAFYHRGRGAGGSSSVNGMFAIRATVEDFDGWAAAGCDGWSYTDVLPLLRAMEDDLDFGDAPYHGRFGPVPVVRTRREDFSPVDAALDRITERLGHPWADDHNAPGSTGASPYAYNARDGRRVSTNDGYLEPARARPGLTVVGDAVVERVLFRGTQAVGVRVHVDGRAVDVRAAEVVVSAGTLHTPAVLQRSGVGPADLLRRVGVDVVRDAPVGLGLQEHAGIAVVMTLLEQPDYRGQPQRGQLCARWTSGVGGETNDLMLANCGALGIGLQVGGLAGWVNRATSTGRVAIASTDPFQHPDVDFALLSTPDDKERFRLLVDHLCEVAEQPEWRLLTSEMAIGTASAEDVRRMSAREFEDWSQANVADTVHATSTCRMGSADDPGAVTDPHGRVHGLDGLRVADASLLPSSTRANTHLSSVLVGEKVAASLRAGS